MSRAASLAEEILSAYSLTISELTLIPGTGGVYEITLNGEEIFSKKELGRFPNEGEIMQLLKTRIA
ncbi:MAG: SelT/SelW/SelH family protein [Tumebacillaceae bacterium]